jgi:hypothetical protein
VCDREVVQLRPLPIGFSRGLVRTWARPASSCPSKMPRRTQQAIGAPAPRVFVPAGGGKASLQVVCNPGRLSRYASPAEAQQNKSLRLEVEVHSAPT